MAVCSFARDAVGWAVFPTKDHIEDQFKTNVGIQFQILHVLAYLWPYSRFVCLDAVACFVGLLRSSMNVWGLVSLQNITGRVILASQTLIY
jgi:hypothetical protein